MTDIQQIATVAALSAEVAALLVVVWEAIRQLRFGHSAFRGLRAYSVIAFMALLGFVSWGDGISLALFYLSALVAGCYLIENARNQGAA